MKLQIKNTLGALLYEAEAASIGDLLALAVRDGANLRGANLRGADLGGANLYGAYLSGANLSGATIIETGETWAEYTSTVVPALLIAGGRPLAEIATLEHWDCHSWKNCPMAAAFRSTGLYGVPILLRPRAEQFIRYFDAKLLPLDLFTKVAA